MVADPFAALGEFLTASEAHALAVHLAAGQHTVKALAVVNAARRGEVKRLLALAGLSHEDRERAGAVLHAIAGAKSLKHDLTPVWTMPGNEAKTGHLTGEFHRIVQAARQSVVCATYNFEESSHMWGVLRQASEQPGVVVTVYVDRRTADSTKVKAQLPRATVYRSAKLQDGTSVVSHAKFTVVDHELLLVTSANFSASAETRNVEFGVLVRDSALARSVESTMASKQGSLYELVHGVG
ncbi:DISARM system phospholipase D-like protein DrmC [Aestuariimicrobium sp. T2.26MG-19.2B]|uniref:DISARM system phospholipase D-like protein DrmC n=1 Tax=Aestuariimicrobium sp. T2.26MG-19.2B TaxID=3040679 RepID=UPI0024774819|nr:DISARM system phospholipase D-like protein DrmC [Aestuariimicrobium sp. T2.26MG-19.2B]CAI9402698.1 Cardiolipin synthase B [Aestuariimicrobium sp. T2.26MG-19.2B]